MPNSVSFSPRVCDRAYGTAVFSFEREFSVATAPTATRSSRSGRSFSCDRAYGTAVSPSEAVSSSYRAYGTAVFSFGTEYQVATAPTETQSLPRRQSQVATAFTAARSLLREGVSSSYRACGNASPSGGSFQWPPRLRQRGGPREVESLGSSTVGAAVCGGPRQSLRVSEATSSR